VIADRLVELVARCRPGKSAVLGHSTTVGLPEGRALAGPQSTPEKQAFAAEVCYPRLAQPVPLLLAVLILSVTCLWAEDTAVPMTPVTKDEVWQAVVTELGQRGLSEDQLPRPEDIELPAAVPAAVGRALRVSTVCWDQDLGRAQVRLECREAGQCLPFLAYIRAARPELRGVASTSCQAGSRSRPAHAVSHKAVVRAGDRATVVFRGSRLRLTAAVICLERGAEGDIIRVRNQDGAIFRARVSAPALLEALSQ
jgi:Chaperone for flagella basal body P-ring formation